MPAQGGVHVVRFGEYELDLVSSELRKHDHKVPLPEQAFRILAMLLERPGEIITREQLIASLWPNGMVVEFDHGINSSVRRLRAVLNDSAERPRYIETLPKRGYRFIFPVQAKEPPAAALAAVVLEQRPATRSRAKWPGVAIGAAAVCALAAFGLVQWRTAQATPISSIAILPLVNTSQDPNTEYLSDGVSEEIINTLSSARHLKVIARTSAFRFKGKEVDPRKAGRELGVDAVLTGTLARHGDALVIQTDLVKVADGSELWGARYDRQISDLQTLQSEIASEIASKLRLNLASADETRLTKRYTENSEAYELYLKAAHAKTFPERVVYLNQSIARDSHFALAYARLASAYEGMGTARVLATKEAVGKVRQSASKALELDGNLAEAHLALALAFIDLDWNWRSAERELKKVIELDPNSGHASYSNYLTLVGRPREALIEAQRAEEIDPLSPVLQGQLVFSYFLSRQYDRAIEKARAPGAGPQANIAQAFSLAEKGHYAESIALLKTLVPSYAGTQGHIGYAYARAGKRVEAERISLELQRRAEKEGVGAYEVAFIDGVLGKKEEAFRWLEIAYQQRDTGLRYLKVDPTVDSLRSDPRFDQLVRRVGLTP